MILKSFIVEKNIKLLDANLATLFYGENIGLKDDLKVQIRDFYKDHEILNLVQDEIIKNNKLLYEQFDNLSLFNRNKIILIQGASEKLKNVILPLIESKNNSTKIFIFSENLEKKSILRSLFEKQKNLAVVPCYQDNERSLSEYIRTKLKDYKGLSQEIINFLINNSGLDRKTISNEIEKIKNLFLDKKIKSEKIISLINNRSNLDFENLRDTCLSAEKELLNKNLGSIVLQSENSYFYLSSLNLRIRKLLELRIQLDKTKDIELAMNNLKPKIFWKDKPIYYKQVKKWDIKKLNEAMKILAESEILLKSKFNNYSKTIIKNLIIQLYKKAATTS